MLPWELLPRAAVGCITLGRALPPSRPGSPSVMWEDTTVLPACAAKRGAPGERICYLGALSVTTLQQGQGALGTDAHCPTAWGAPCCS